MINDRDRPRIKLCQTKANADLRVFTKCHSGDDCVFTSAAEYEIVGPSGHREVRLVRRFVRHFEKPMVEKTKLTPYRLKRKAA